MDNKNQLIALSAGERKEKWKKTEKNQHSVSKKDLDLPQNLYSALASRVYWRFRPCLFKDYLGQQLPHITDRDCSPWSFLEWLR